MTNKKIAATLLAWVLIAYAQQPSRPTAQPARTQTQSPQVLVPTNAQKISVETQLVVETVFVKDKSGKPVSNLKKEDFLVAEDGKPQDISFFDYEELSETATPAAPEPAPAEKTPAASTKATPAKAAAPATPPAEEPPSDLKPLTANQIAPEKPGDLQYKDKRLMVMFFDMTSMPVPDQVRAQTAAQKFIKTQMTPSDLMAIMVFTSDIKVLQDFTDDRDLLTKEVKGLTLGTGQGFDETTSDDSTADTGAAFTQDDTEFNIFNTDRQLSALEQAVQMLSALNEKKALVYFASGMTRNGVDNDAQLRATINAAIRANVAFYPIDARGLVASAPLGDATKSSPGGNGMYTGSSARAAQSNFQGQQETLYTLASDTGGKALLDNNDLSVGIQNAQKDISSYYIIGYYSHNGKLDGQFRKVDIKVKPPKNANLAALDYRHGYYAGKDFTKFTSDDKERQLSAALMLNDPITDITIAAEIDYFRLARDRYFVPLEVKIPGSELQLAKSKNVDKTTMDFIGRVTDDNQKDKEVQNFRESIDIKLSGETASTLAKRPIAYDAGFVLPPGKYTVKFLARENATGKIGTYQTHFVIPDLTAAQATTLPTSSVILASQRTALSDAAYSAEKDKKLLALNPLFQDGKQLIPSVTRVFNKNQQMYVYLEAYEPDATAANTQPLYATVTFFHGKDKAFETDPLQVSTGLNDKSKALPLRFSLPLASIKAGNYTCQVNVLDPSGQKYSIWRSGIVVTN